MSQLELGGTMFLAGLLLGMVFYHFFGVKRAKIVRLVTLIAESVDKRIQDAKEFAEILSLSHREIDKLRAIVNTDTDRFERQVRVIDELKDVINDQSKELRDCWAFASDQVAQFKSAREIFIYYPDGLAMVDKVIGQLTFLNSKIVPYGKDV